MKTKKVMRMYNKLKKGTKQAISEDSEIKQSGTTVYLFEHQIEMLKEISGDGSYNALLRNILTEYLATETNYDLKEKSRKAGAGDSSKQGEPNDSSRIEQ